MSMYGLDNLLAGLDDPAPAYPSSTATAPNLFTAFDQSGTVPHTAAAPNPFTTATSTVSSDPTAAAAERERQEAIQDLSYYGVPTFATQPVGTIQYEVLNALRISIPPRDNPNADWRTYYDYTLKNCKYKKSAYTGSYTWDCRDAAIKCGRDNKEKVKAAKAAEKKAKRAAASRGSKKAYLPGQVLSKYPLDYGFDLTLGGGNKRKSKKSKRINKKSKRTNKRSKKQRKK